MTTTIWQIWENPEGSEGCTKPADGKQTLDLDGVPMLLKHQFEVTGGTIDDYEHVRRAFDYSNKWNHDEGEWPEAVKPLDANIQRCMTNESLDQEASPSN